MSRRLSVTVLIVSGIVAVFAMLGLVGCVSGPSSTSSSSKQATTSSAQPVTNSSVGTSSSLASTTTSSARSTTPVVSRWPPGIAAVVVQAWAGFKVIDARGVVFSATDPTATGAAPSGTDSSGMPMSVVVSPNGKYIAYRFAGGELIVRILATGETVDHLPVGPKDEVQAVSDDGRFVALVASDARPGVSYPYPGPKETVAIADLTLKERTVPISVAQIVTDRPHGDEHLGQIDWLPDDDLLLSINGQAPNPQAYLYSPRSDAVTPVPGLGGVVMVSPHGEVLAYSKKLTHFSVAPGGYTDVPLPVVWRNGVAIPIVPAFASPGPSAAISPDGSTVVMTVDQKPGPRGWQAFREMNGEWRPVTKVSPLPLGVDWLAPSVVSQDGRMARGLAMQGSLEYMVSLDTVTGQWTTYFTGQDELTTIIDVVPTVAGESESYSDVRIGVIIPAYILYQGQLYTGTGQVVGTTNHTPADLSLVGSGLEAGDQRGVAVPGSGQYDIYAIEGTSQEKAIAIKFQGTSSSGPVWVWLKYERKQ